MEHLKDLFKHHLNTLISQGEKALEALQYTCFVLGSGEPFTYFEDDSHAVFKSNPHFAHWCPAKGPHHFLKYSPGQKPLLVYYSPHDFWDSHEELGNPYWQDFFDIRIVHQIEKLWISLGDCSGGVFIGQETKYAKASQNIKINCEIFTARLNWFRRYKSEYEIYCHLEANKIAASGHNAAKEIFLAGGSEYEIHMGYLMALGQLDENLPYSGIVALDKNAAILHYRLKNQMKKGKVLLIDSGASYANYHSDITRTYSVPGVSPVFDSILHEMKLMQKALCDSVKVGQSFPELHEKCLFEICRILEKNSIIKSSDDKEISLQIVKNFMPHGLGHMLGVQVHDIGGKQIDKNGVFGPLPSSASKSKTLRFVGNLEENMLVTIEPGLYFIPMLLDKLKSDSKLNSFVNWELVSELVPLGGIRIEDNVLVTKNAPRNLTREYLPN